VEERKQSKKTFFHVEDLSELEFDNSPKLNTYLALPTIRRENKRSSPMFSFKDISKV